MLCNKKDKRVLNAEWLLQLYNISFELTLTSAECAPAANLPGFNQYWDSIKVRPGDATKFKHGTPDSFREDTVYKIET